jgi:hypothetical protein
VGLVTTALARIFHEPFLIGWEASWRLLVGDCAGWV